MNSLLGMVNLGTSYSALPKADCEKMQKELGLKWCYNSNDYYAGAVKACHDLGMHLPSMATLAQIATLQYGAPVDTYENVCVEDSCRNYGYSNKTRPENYSSPLSESFNNVYVWSGEEKRSSNAYGRYFDPSAGTLWYNFGRYDSDLLAVCLGD